MISFKDKGDLSKTLKYLGNLKKSVKPKDLDRFGKEGVAALSAATPINTGNTANSWYYEIKTEKNSTIISFHNSNIQNKVPIAIILQYGHGTRNGGYVEGRDYINPAMRPLFDKITQEAWREVTKL